MSGVKVAVSDGMASQLWSDGNLLSDWCQILRPDSPKALPPDGWFPRDLIKPPQPPQTPR